MFHVKTQNISKNIVKRVKPNGYYIQHLGPLDGIQNLFSVNVAWHAKTTIRLRSLSHKAYEESVFIACGSNNKNQIDIDSYSRRLGKINNYKTPMNERNKKSAIPSLNFMQAQWTLQKTSLFRVDQYFKLGRCRSDFLTSWLLYQHRFKAQAANVSGSLIREVTVKNIKYFNREIYFNVRYTGCPTKHDSW